MTSTCVETPAAKLPTTILPTIVPTKQLTIQENESVGPCAGVLQYEQVSGKPIEVASVKNLSEVSGRVAAGLFTLRPLIL